MSGGAIDRDLALCLEALRRDLGESVKVDRIAALVQSLLADPPGEISAGDLKLYHEIESLARYIHAAREEIAALRPRDPQTDVIASATDELDAIVDHTETATNNILDAAEKIEMLIGEVSPEIADKLTEATTQIYESCNFQDITGQRITKVVKALKHIEEKVDALVNAFAPEVAAAEQAAPAAGPPTDQDLLNGPQLPDKASRQDEVDALLASFD